MAPEGHALVVGDLSQIEPRVLAWLSDYDDLLGIFAAGGDAYATFGAQMFNIPNLTKESHPDLRQSAKSALLGCGYGMGWASFAAQLLTGFLGAPPVMYDKGFAKKLGITPDYVEHFLSWDENVKQMEAIPHTCTELELAIHCVAAKKIIDIYRATAHPVVSFWEMCRDLLVSSLYGGKEFRYKCVVFRKGEIELPNGMKLLYPNLRTVKDDKDRIQFVYGDDETKLYAGKITNNITQAVARIVMTDGMLRVSKRYPVVGTVHDEQIVCVPEEEAADALNWVLAQMTMEPKYMQGIPLNADGGTHKRYGLAKN
jgi:DNA polymerase